MKKIRFYPKLFLNHFKKRPSRIVTWFSILAITFALVATLINPNNLAKAAPGITVGVNSVTMVGDSSYIDCSFLNPKDPSLVISFTQMCQANQYIIDVDGYILIRLNTDKVNRPLGFEYHYFIDPNTWQKVQINPSTDLVIDGPNTIVYIESNQTKPIQMDSLTVSNGAVLTQTPAGLSGLNVPFSTNYYWAIQLMSYYYLGPNRRVAFFLPAANNSTQNISLKISERPFNKSNLKPENNFGSRFDVDTTNLRDGIVSCFIDKNIGDWCGQDGAENSPNTWFTNSTSSGKLISVQLISSFDTTNNNDMVLNHYEQDITDINNPIDFAGTSNSGTRIPVDKFTGLNSNGSSSVANPGFGNSTIGFAYYYDQYGNANHRSIDALNLDQVSRAFQTLNIPISTSAGLYDWGLAKTRIDYDSNNYFAYQFNWDGNGKNRPGNPLSNSMMPYGVDYLRAPYAPYVIAALTGTNGAREARLNIEVANNVTLTSNGRIDVSGKGFAGGHAGFGRQDYDTIQKWSIDKNNVYPGNNSMQFPLSDHPAWGAGFGGGKGLIHSNPNDACSGSYGGNGVTANYDVKSSVENANDDNSVSCGHTYGGGENIQNPIELGSGGGYYNKSLSGFDSTAIGGSGGGSVHLKADSIIIGVNSYIKSNGGNGFVTPAYAWIGGNNIDFWLINSKGILGKPGYPLLEESFLYNQGQEANYRYDRIQRGTAGSGGSVFLETNIFSNQGSVEARGVDGALRYLNTKNPTIVDQYSNEFNSDSVFQCSETSTSNCAGAASGGGRISVIFNDDGGGLNKGTIRAWGGGWNGGPGGSADQFNSTWSEVSFDISGQYEIPAYGGEGTIFYQKSTNSNIYNKTISIDKSVNLCKNGEDSCKAGATRDVDLGNATASDGAWMLVQIHLINNTGKDQNTISITDEKFATLAVPSTITAVTDSTNWFDNGSNVGWNNISIPTGANNQKTLEYYFQVKGN